MRDYFKVSYEKDKVLRCKDIYKDALVVNLIELQRQNYKIVAIKDEFAEYHDLKEMIEIYKESIDIEYEDVKTKLEAYELAFDYYKDLYRNSYISNETYNKYISEIKKYRKEIKDKDEFITKIKDLYVLGV